MDESKCCQEPKKEKGFWAKLIDRLDKKLEDKAKGSCCCKAKDKEEGDQC